MQQWNLSASLLALLLAIVNCTAAQNWEIGVIPGASFIAQNKFPSGFGLRTVFFTPQVDVRRCLDKRLAVHATISSTRFNYYKRGTHYMEADTYKATGGVSYGIASGRLMAGAGLGLVYWNYYLNNYGIFNFVMVPAVEYRLVGVKKKGINVGLVGQYAFIPSTNAYLNGWLTIGGQGWFWFWGGQAYFQCTLAVRAGYCWKVRHYVQPCNF